MGRWWTRSGGDGLIISTPTGSTGYSDGAGGPILHPASMALVSSDLSDEPLQAAPWWSPRFDLVVVAMVSQSPGEPGRGPPPPCWNLGDACLVRRCEHSALMVVLEQSPSYYRT